MISGTLFTMAGKIIHAGPGEQPGDVRAVIFAVTESSPENLYNPEVQYNVVSLTADIVSYLFPHLSHKGPGFESRMYLLRKLREKVPDAIEASRNICHPKIRDLAGTMEKNRVSDKTMEKRMRDLAGKEFSHEEWWSPITVNVPTNQELAVMYPS
jgi:hypothetical protein